MIIDAQKLQTEMRNPRTEELDLLEGEELARTLHRENYAVAEAVERVLPQVGQAIERIAASWKAGGRLFYLGAGTSGRIGVLDASECPPTFGTPASMVCGIIAGGDAALRNSIEGAEDSRDAGRDALQEAGVQVGDVVVGIAASGRTPFALGALEAAREAGAFAIAVVNVSPSEMERVADLTIAAVTGPEALTGSTRLKAGTAQKMILNLLSTGAMARIGKTYSNLMVDVRATNVKLRDRALRIVMMISGAEREEAIAALEASDWRCKTAIVALKLGVASQEADVRLEQAAGFVRNALNG